MNFSVSGVLLLCTGFITLTFLILSEFVYERFVLRASSELTSYSGMAFEDFTFIYISSIFFIIIGVIMVACALFIHLKKK